MAAVMAAKAGLVKTAFHGTPERVVPRWVEDVLFMREMYDFSAAEMRG